MAADWTETDSTVLRMLAHVLAGQNRAEEAAGLLDYLLRRDPGNRQARRAAAGAYLLAGRYSEALDTIAAAEPLDDGDVLMLIKGQALWELGLTADASETVSRYLGQTA